MYMLPGHPGFHSFTVLGYLECFYWSTSLLLLERVADRRKAIRRKKWVDEGKRMILKVLDAYKEENSCSYISNNFRIFSLLH